MFNKISSDIIPPKFGDLRVVYIHQVGRVVPITCPAKDVFDAYQKVQLITNLMLSLYMTHAIPDYANVVIVEEYEMNADYPEGGAWVEWSNVDGNAWFQGLEDLVENHSHNGWMLASTKPFIPEIGEQYTLIDTNLQVTIFDNTEGAQTFNNPAFDKDAIVAWRPFYSPDNGIRELKLIPIE